MTTPLCPLTPKELRRFAELSELRPGVCPELRALGIQLAEGKKDSDYFDLAIITSRLLASALDQVAELEARLRRELEEQAYLAENPPAWLREVKL